MENGKQNPEDQQQRPARQDLLDQQANAKWQLCNGDRNERSGNAKHTKPQKKGRHLGSRPIFIVPVHADPSAHFFCCPPGQQVLELHW